MSQPLPDQCVGGNRWCSKGGGHVSASTRQVGGSEPGGFAWTSLLSFPEVLGGLEPGFGGEGGLPPLWLPKGSRFQGTGFSSRWFLLANPGGFRSRGCASSGLEPFFSITLQATTWLLISFFSCDLFFSVSSSLVEASGHNLTAFLPNGWFIAESGAWRLRREKLPRSPAQIPNQRTITSDNGQ